MVLNRNPDNFFNDNEQVAFCPAIIVPGKCQGSQGSEILCWRASGEDRRCDSDPLLESVWRGPAL